MHAVPGTNHVLFKGHTSLDKTRQHKYVDTIITKLKNDHNNTNTNIPTSNTTSEAAALPSPSSMRGLQQEPYCFVVDTDSIPYIIDTGANRIIVNDARHLQNLVATSDKIKGIGGKCVRIAGVGTLSLSLRSDDGNIDVISGLNAVYVPSSPYNLIPPQILIKQMKIKGFAIDRFNHDDKDYTFVYSSPSLPINTPPRSITVPLGSNQLFTLRTSEGYSNFMSRAPKYLDSFKHFVGASHFIPEDDASITPSFASPTTQDKTRENNTTPLLPSNTSSIIQDKTRETTDKTREMNINLQQGQPCSIPYKDIDFDPIKVDPILETFHTSIHPNSLPDDDVDIVATREKQFRLLTIHERLGHISFAKLKLMARCGIIPRELANVTAPCCPGCAYGKAHRKPTRSKGIRNIRQIKSVNAPGLCVSVDQLVSPTPGFVPTHRGIPTLQRYKGATVFVDNYSDFTYTHLMTKMNAESTVEAKESFERIAHSHNVPIRHYHCDNGLFDTKAFKLSVHKAKQIISFCGVNAHHQNGKAERRIKNITGNARTALLHASHRWPKAIHASLWPCALKHYVNLRNNLPSTYIAGGKDGRKKLPDKYINSPTSKFSGVETPVNLKVFHPFGSPVYVLANKLQARQLHNKWTDRSRVGIFLQHSPNHSSSVPLVLNTSSGNVSPQFHCLYDDSFDTCRRDFKFNSIWQEKAKLYIDNTTTTTPSPTDPTNIPIQPLPATQLPSPTMVDFNMTTPHNINPPAETDNLPSEFNHQWDTPEDIGETPLNVTFDTNVDIIPLPPQDIVDDVPIHITRSGRTSQPPRKFADSAHSSIKAFTSTFCPSVQRGDIHLL